MCEKVFDIIFVNLKFVCKLKDVQVLVQVNFDGGGNIDENWWVKMVLLLIQQWIMGDDIQQMQCCVYELEVVQCKMLIQVKSLCSVLFSVLVSEQLLLVLMVFGFDLLELVWVMVCFEGEINKFIDEYNKCLCKKFIGV